MTNQATVVGNLASDPELKYTPTGKAVVSFSIADTPRSFDKASGQWVDGETDWVRVVAWDNLAENIAASLRKGNQIIAIGHYRARKYTDKNTQEQRTSRELTAEFVGPNLQFATAVVEKAQRKPNNNGGGGYNGGNAGGNPAPAQAGSFDDTPF